MRHYEIVVIIHPDQSEQVEEMVKRYTTLVTEGGGRVHRTENWGRRALAYPLQKNLYKAHYLLMNIECDNGTLAKLEESFRFNDMVLRTLVLKRERKESGDSVMMAASRKGESPGRGKEERRA